MLKKVEGKGVLGDGHDLTALVARKKADMERDRCWAV
jgi:hypothetical protein